ncbi:MAG: hypothetical protein IPO66_19145 [Rhodanobacteraceae bacterium]|nr:hypothetical protein [Rhodanobacteraceae bacterium]
MRIQRPAVCSLLGLCALALTSLAAAAQAESLGAKYGSREPTRCADTSDPASGAPSVEQASQYLKRTMEIEGGGPSLYLLEDLELQVAPRGRAYDRQAPISDVDPTQPIFDIRGSYLLYQCSPAYSSASGSNLGANCYTYAHPKAAGVCWKTSFGDWGCSMSDRNHGGQTRDVAPPQ